MAKAIEDLTGSTINQLYVERLLGRDRHSHTVYEARCVTLVEGRKCGKLRRVKGHDLKTGAVKACRDCGQKSQKEANNRWYVQTFYARGKPRRQARKVGAGC